MHVSVGGAGTVLSGERALLQDLEFGGHHLRRQFGLVATEQGDEEDAPRSDQVDRCAAGEAHRSAVGRLLDLAAELGDPRPAPRSVLPPLTR